MLSVAAIHSIFFDGNTHCSFNKKSSHFKDNILSRGSAEMLNVKRNEAVTRYKVKGETCLSFNSEKKKKKIIEALIRSCCKVNAIPGWDKVVKLLVGSRSLWSQLIKSTNAEDAERLGWKGNDNIDGPLDPGHLFGGEMKGWQVKWQIDTIDNTFKAKTRWFI